MLRNRRLILRWGCLEWGHWQKLSFYGVGNAAEVGHVCHRVSYHWENYMAVLLPQYLCGGKLKSGAGTLAGSRWSQIRFSVWKRQQKRNKCSRVLLLPYQFVPKVCGNEETN